MSRPNARPPAPPVSSGGTRTDRTDRAVAPGHPLTHNSLTQNAVTQNPLWVLLPLRLFLGATFLYAGLSKIADRSFLDEKSPSSMHATLLAVKGSSPIGGLLGPVVDHTFVFGLFMALAETAVGIGTLLGLFSRIAAFGGMVLSFSLFLTVSWGASPWYTGADIVYFFTFTPLILAGALPFSVDEWLARAAVTTPGVAEDRTRRALLAGAAAVGALCAVGISSLFRSGAASTDAATGTSGKTGTTGTTGTTAPSASGSASASSGGKALVAASAVPVGGGKEVTDPTTGDQVWVLQLDAGKFTAVDAKCPHQGCAVGFVSKSTGFRCPCHNSTFTSSGALINGPATTGLKAVPVTESGGQITRA